MHRSTQALAASAAALSLVLVGCSSDEGGEPHPVATPPADDPVSFEQSAEHIDEDILDAVEDGVALDYDSAEQLQSAAAAEYARLVDETGDQAVAEAQLANYFSDRLLDRKAELWTHQDYRTPFTFVSDHPGVASAQPVVDSSEGIARLSWEAECDTVDAHFLDIYVEVEEIDGDYQLTALHHRGDCGCADCTAA